MYKTIVAMFFLLVVVSLRLAISGYGEKREVVEKNNCSLIVRAVVYKKPLLSWPPPIFFPNYENHVVLEDGRTEVFDSTFIYKEGQLRCHFYVVRK